ncbi:MAG TPA: histidine kinase [Puia sp.]|nr:histidine kinase [Puia sp.]
MLFNFRKWLIKYKVPYIICWVVVSLFITSVNYDVRAPLMPQIIANLLFTGLTIPICYLEYSWLVPNYLYKRRFARFIIYSIIIIIAGSVIDYLISMLSYHLLTGHKMFPSLEYVLGLLNTAILISLISAALGLMLKIISNRFQMERELHEIEKEKINTELNFLRSQVNPHFLFNVLNTIYFQIDRSNTQARGSVEKLSEMLRYQLYECTTDKINIQAEVEYIKNYVAMQTLRMENGTDIKLCCDDNLSGFHIAPLLLLPVIENAFKHVSNFRNAADNKIHLQLKKDEHDFILKATNTYDKSLQTKYISNSGGLGMQNLKRRLGLLYPNRHLFLIDQQENTFSITLKIHYDD